MHDGNIFSICLILLAVGRLFFSTQLILIDLMVKNDCSSTTMHCIIMVDILQDGHV